MGGTKNIGFIDVLVGGAHVSRFVICDARDATTLILFEGDLKILIE